MRGVEARELRVVESEHARHLLADTALGGTVGPGVAGCVHAKRIAFEQGGLGSALGAEHQVAREAPLTLLQPVTVGVGGDVRPAARLRDADDAAECRNGLELLLAREVVADVAEKDAAALLHLGVLHEERDCDGRTAAAAEDLAAVPLRELARGPLVAPEVEDVEAAKLLREALAKAARRARLDESGIGHEPDNSARADAVTGPADRTDVAVVEGILIRGIGAGYVGLRDPPVERRVRDVLVVVVLGALPR